MNNNQGFTLIQVMIVAVVLSVIAALGMSYFNYNAKRINANQQSSQTNLLVMEVQSTASHEGSISNSEGLQFNKALATPTP